MNERKTWMNKRKKKKKLDREDILINYHCRFVSATTHEGHSPADNLNRDGGDDSFDCHLTGDEVRSFYENLVSGGNTRSSSQSQKHHNKDSSLAVGGEKRKHKQAKLVARDKSTGQCSSQPAKSVLENPCKKAKIKKETIASPPSDIESVKKLVARMFKLCSDDSNIEALKNILDEIRCRTDYATILNASDQYGWTALMCAAAEGCIEIVQLLVEEGTLYGENITDKSGFSIYDICERRQQWSVKEYLRTMLPTTSLSTTGAQKRRRKSSNRYKSEDAEVELIQCPLCGVEYRSHERKQHESSTVHLFKDKSKQVPQQWYALPDNNIGFQMMLRSGWEVDEGLGPDGSGRKNPIKTVLKQDRAGLGLIENPEKRISHFNAFDKNAVSRTRDGKRSDTRKNRSGGSSTNTDKMKNDRKDKHWERNMRRYLSSDD